MGDNYSATPMKAWDTIAEGRDTLSWQRGRHAVQFGGSCRKFIWPMWGFFQNRGYYQFTNGFTTDNGTNDGAGSALASFLLGLPAIKQRQAGIPQMQLRQWYADGFIQDSFRGSSTTTIEMGLRYEFMEPLVDISYTNSNLTFENGTPSAFIGGENGFPKGLKYPNPHNECVAATSGTTCLMFSRKRSRAITSLPRHPFWRRSSISGIPCSARLR
jgi:hypothetical protein